MRLRFVLLGSGAVRNNPRRGGPAQFLQLGERVLLFDCGRSACTHLAQAGVKIETIDRLFFTHLHFDHVVDTAYFVFLGWNNGRKQVLKVFGPRGTRNFIAKLIRPPFEEDIRSRLGHGKPEFGLDPEVVEAPEQGEVLAEEGYRVSALAIPHGNITSLAYRIEAEGRRVVVCGDGLPTPELAEFARNADLIAMECSGTAEFLARQPWGSWHATPPLLAAFAQEAGVRRLLLKHFVMEDIDADPHAAEVMAGQIRAGFDGEVIAGLDGLEVELHPFTAPI